MTAFLSKLRQPIAIPAFGRALPEWTTAEREPPAPSSRRFFSAKIEGYWFSAIVGRHGPEFQAGDQRVAFGRAMLYRYPSGTWTVCEDRYSVPKIGLDGLSEQGLRELADTFGIPFYPVPAGSGSQAFEQSAAAPGFRQWLRDNAPLARRLRAKNPATAEWFERNRN